MNMDKNWQGFIRIGNILRIEIWYEWEREVHKEFRTQISVPHLGEVNPLIEKLPTLNF
jgi:hypothetical protein